LDGKTLGFLGVSYFGTAKDDIRKAINANPRASDLTGAEIIIDHTLEDISISSETAEIHPVFNMQLLRQNQPMT